VRGWILLLLQAGVYEHKGYWYAGSETLSLALRQVQVGLIHLYSGDCFAVEDEQRSPPAGWISKEGICKQW